MLYYYYFFFFLIFFPNENLFVVPHPMNVSMAGIHTVQFKLCYFFVLSYLIILCGNHLTILSALLICLVILQPRVDDLMESKLGKKSSSKSLFYEVPLGYSIEDIRPNGDIKKFQSAEYANVSFWLLNLDDLFLDECFEFFYIELHDPDIYISENIAVRSKTILTSLTGLWSTSFDVQKQTVN